MLLNCGVGEDSRESLGLHRGMSGPWIRQIGRVQSGDSKSERQCPRNQRTKMIRMGEFNSDDHYIYYYGQDSLRRNGLAIMVNNRVQNAVLECNLKKWQNDLSSFPRKTIQYHSNPSLCPNQYAEEAEIEWFNGDLQDLLELTSEKDVLFITGD